MRGRHLFLLFCLFVTGTVQADDVFRLQSIVTDGVIQDVFIGDYNGDRRQDLCLLVIKKTESGIVRELQLYFQKRPLFAQPDAVLDCPPHTIALDFGEVLDDGVTRPVLLTEQGVFVWKTDNPDASALVPVIHETHSLYSVQPDRLFRIPFLVSQGNQNPAIIVWSTPQQHHVYEKKDGVYCQSRSLPVISDLCQIGNEMRFEIPRFVFSGSEESGQHQFWQLFSHGVFQVDLFAPSDSSKASLWIAPRYFEERTLYPLDEPKTYFEAEDLDGNGSPDCVAVQSVRGGLTSHISHVQIYLNRSDQISEMPDQVLLTNNIHGEHQFCDLNRDGLPDLLAFHLKTDLFQAAQFLFTGNVSVGVDVFLNHQTGFSQTPDQTLSWAMPVRLDAILLSPFEGWFAKGDFNGDSYPDLFVQISHGQYLITPGLPSGLFDSAHRQSFELEGSADFDIADLNGDDHSDLLFLAPQSQYNTLHCYLSP